ncbi:hypothetical protein BLA60_12450 [Actinophytocola xinjiangensis]|uniref:Integrase-like protein n=1 Tax=Actinophytocola xinjiangensis TaxID=485602 RepID=A0A7Z0WNK5_9PSEU|nr:hypothetical protein BLA60_12450 [Actinophytocola xinjiangensis]
MGETIEAGTPNIDKVAEQALTRWLNRVDEQRAPRTTGTVNQLIDAYFEVVDIDRDTMRGWQVQVFERFFAEPRRCRKHCDRRPWARSGGPWPETDWESTLSVTGRHGGLIQLPSGSGGLPTDSVSRPRRTSSATELIMR